MVAQYLSDKRRVDHESHARIKIPFFVNGSKDNDSFLCVPSCASQDVQRQGRRFRGGAGACAPHQGAGAGADLGPSGGLGRPQRERERWREVERAEREREGERGRMCLVLALTDLHSNLRSSQNAR